MNRESRNSCYSLHRSLQQHTLLLVLELFVIGTNMTQKVDLFLPGTSKPSTSPEGPYTLPMELGPPKTIPILVLGT